MCTVCAIDESYIIVVLIVALDIWIGFWVFFADRKSSVNQRFSLLAFLLILWAVFCYAKSVLPQDIGLILVQAAYAVVALFFYLLYFFLNDFPKKEKRNPILDKIIFGVGFFLSFFSFSGSMVESIGLINGKHAPILGEGRFIYLGIISFLILFITARFVIRYLKFTAAEKLKAQYFLIGFIIFISVNFVFNIVFPIIQSNAQYACIGNHSAIFLLCFTALAIIRRKLFEIKVVLTDSLIGILGVILFTFPFFLNGLRMKILGAGVFFLFCIIAYLLIRYTHQEIRQKEILEQEVKERTKKIQNQLDEIQRWHRVTVGRELKMVELKKEIGGKEKRIGELKRKIGEKE